MARAKRSRRSVASSPAHDTAPHERDTAADLVPGIGTAAIAVAATAVLEAEFLPAILIGAGAALAPSLLRSMGFMIRPFAKTVIKAGYGTYRTMANLAAEVTEEFGDIAAEARAELPELAEEAAEAT